MIHSYYGKMQSENRKDFFFSLKILVGIPIFFGIIKDRDIFMEDREKSRRYGFHVSETQNI